MGLNNFLYLLNDALKNQNIQLALDSVKTFRAADLADILSQLPIENSQILLQHLPDRGYVFAYLSPDTQMKFANLLPRQTLAEIVGEMSSDKRADLFKNLNLEQQDALLPALAQAEREDIRLLSS